MTVEEYEKRLSELSEKEFQKFNDEFGGGQKTVEERVREFVDNPQHERRICQLLGLRTENEKFADAANQSAFAAKQSAVTGKWALFVSIVALVVAIVALFVNG